VHPALSVIVFTTASGAGYGLLALAGLLFALGVLPPQRGVGLCALGLGTILVTGGLLASTSHLGRPERAWRAITQVRTSWLSREAVAALLAYIPIAIFGIGWVMLGRADRPVLIAALATPVLAVVTVHCTAMIYRSLKPVHQWCNGHVVPVYHVLAVLTGALLLNALLHLWGGQSQLVALIAILAAALGAALKARYWRFVDTTRAASTPETATGLSGMGKVRLLEPPHTGSNYLMREMGFHVARRHAVKLRRIVQIAAFAIPLALLILASLAPPIPAAFAAVIAAVSGLAGTLVERWLFFAEAKHSVTLYYGADAA
jgi:DMSO reductase anchor subunit